MYNPFCKGSKIVWRAFEIFEALLAFRFFLRLLGADSSNGFARFFYSITASFVKPFIHAFSLRSFDGRAVEWTTLLAMVAYWLIALLIIKLLFWNEEEYLGKLKENN